MGTFGGNFGQANAINDRGQVAGFATNTILVPMNGGVPVSIAADGCDVDLAVPTQTRAFIWEGGAIRDLGTLGGTDSCAVFINQRGQVAGYSFTDPSAPAACGLSTKSTIDKAAMTKSIRDGSDRGETPRTSNKTRHVV